MKPSNPLPVIGWREWALLPDLADEPIKAKVDTGAQTSALHAFALEVMTVDGQPFASFELHPRQRSKAGATRVTHPIKSFRKIRSSNGRAETRPVIVTTVQVGERAWPIEITLTSRDSMGFRMLLGRSALKARFLVDAGRSYVQSGRVQAVTRKPTP